MKITECTKWNKYLGFAVRRSWLLQEECRLLGATFAIRFVGKLHMCRSGSSLSMPTTSNLQLFARPLLRAQSANQSHSRQSRGSTG